MRRFATAREAGGVGPRGAVTAGGLSRVSSASYVAGLPLTPPNSPIEPAKPQWPRRGLVNPSLIHDVTLSTEFKALITCKCPAWTDCPMFVG